jgi:N-[(2S)-2-amino-2-carboxyethyl]-L-glutamate dehydrogenase
MRDDDILILTGNEILGLLAGRELEVIQTVQSAYEAYAKGDSSLPHSSFLRFPSDEKNRIIALPAYLGGEFNLAGIKWIASFPDNLERGMDRASATVILNSPSTGRPQGILEGSIISARRTAASAALAARYLRGEENTSCLGLIGCGHINYEIARFLLMVFPALSNLVVFDLDPDRARSFKKRCRKLTVNIEVETVSGIEAVFRRAQLISFATTAAKPYVRVLPPDSTVRTILHISLRDLAPEVILAYENIVDDIDHVCRAQTSLHLAEQMSGNRNFITSTLGDLISNGRKASSDARGPVIFSPFGLGILDLAVGKLVYDLGTKQGVGKVIKSFIPDSWDA